MIASLTKEEIMKRAINGKVLTKEEVLEIYADGTNWIQDHNGPNSSCRWIWKGPSICPLDPALWALNYGELPKW